MPSPSTLAPAAAPATPLEAILRRDRSIVAVGLVGVTLLAWGYLLSMAAGMSQMDMGADMAMPRVGPWTALNLVLLFVMWAVMMVGMMVPSAAPMVILFARVNRQRHERHAPVVPTAAFLGGYLLVWTGFSALATLLQWGLHTAALLSPMMVSTSPVLGGALLVAAGAFQWTPLKRACLVHCRSPLHFFVSEWRDKTAGALLMGTRHGVYCVGCCWVLMALLFVAGVMNLLWVGAIAAFVLIERVVPKGDLVGRVAGVVLVAAGVAVLARRL